MSEMHTPWHSAEDRMVMAAIYAAAFVKRNVVGLWDLMKISPEPGALVALERLIELCDDGRPDPIAVELVLHTVFEALLNIPFAEIGARANRSVYHQDLDAAVRWNLARVTDLARRFALARE